MSKLWSRVGRWFEDHPLLGWLVACIAILVVGFGVAVVWDTMGDKAMVTGLVGFAAGVMLSRP